MRADIKLTLVPYKGGTTQITGLLAGDIPLGMETHAPCRMARRQDQDPRHRL